MKVIGDYKILEEREIGGLKLKYYEKDGNMYLWCADEKLDLLSLFFRSWNQSRDVRDDLLPIVKSIIERKENWEQLDAPLVTAMVQYGVTEFCDENTPKTIKLKTSDLFLLINDWLEFLESQGK